MYHDTHFDDISIIAFVIKHVPPNLLLSERTLPEVGTQPPVYDDYA